jgi:hypothetical protein
MMNDPIVVWPPGTFWGDCSSAGWNYYDCGNRYPELASYGALICCPA